MNVCQHIFTKFWTWHQKPRQYFNVLLHFKGDQKKFYINYKIQSVYIQIVNRYRLRQVSNLLMAKFYTWTSQKKVCLFAWIFPNSFNRCLDCPTFPSIIFFFIAQLPHCNFTHQLTLRFPNVSGLTYPRAFQNSYCFRFINLNSTFVKYSSLLLLFSPPSSEAIYFT